LRVQITAESSALQVGRWSEAVQAHEGPLLVSLNDCGYLSAPHMADFRTKLLAWLDTLSDRKDVLVVLVVEDHNELDAAFKEAFGGTVVAFEWHPIAA